MANLTTCSRNRNSVVIIFFVQTTGVITPSTGLAPAWETSRESLDVNTTEWHMQDSSWCKVGPRFDQKSLLEISAISCRVQVPWLRD